MKSFIRGTAVLLAVAGALGAAQAQLPSLSGLTGGMPDVSSMSAGNAAGVLSYCVKNKYLGGGDASSVLGGLTGKPDVKSSSDYADGQAGKLDLGGDSSLSMDSVTGKMKSKVCNLVLKNAKSLL